MIQKIIADETWLEGERRGCCVSPEDPVVRENVCLVIIRVGAAMRASILAGCTAILPAGTGSLPVVHEPHAA